MSERRRYGSTPVCEDGRVIGIPPICYLADLTEFQRNRGISRCEGLRPTCCESSWFTLEFCEIALCVCESSRNTLCFASRDVTHKERADACSIHEDIRVIITFEWIDEPH